MSHIIMWVLFSICHSLDSYVDINLAYQKFYYHHILNPLIIIIIYISSNNLNIKQTLQTLVIQNWHKQSTFLALRPSTYQIMFFTNIGYTFNQTNTLIFTEVPKSFDATEDGSTIVLASITTIFINDLQSNGEYSIVQTITYFDMLHSTRLTNDGEILVVEFLILTKADVYRRQNGQYIKSQQITDSAQKLLGAEFTTDKSRLALSGYENVVRVYDRTQEANYELSQELIATGSFILAMSDTKLLTLNHVWVFTYFLHTGTQYDPTPQTFSSPEPLVLSLGYSKDLTTFAFGTISSTLYVYEFINQTYTQTALISLPALPININIDEDKLYFNVMLLDGTLRVFYKCPAQCTTCLFPNNCTACSDGYQLHGGQCLIPPSHCVNNIFQYQDICEEYCSARCATCTTTRNKCHQCAKYYKMNQDGECVVDNEVLDIVLKIRPFLNLIRKGSLQFLFMALDDLWLYEYHKPNYTGQVKVVFSTIKFIQQQQWSVIGLSTFKDTIEGCFTIPQYNSHSNKKYLEIARKNNILLENTLLFLCFFLPLTVIFVIFCRVLFFRLFNYEVSKFLRLWSFWWVLLEMLVVANVEYFTFLGFRLLQVAFSFGWVSKVALAGSIVMFFFVWFAAFAAYGIYYVSYGKLGRYFLNNLYRFPSSYVIMTFLYGVRPFLKGFTHALFYENNFLQLWLLLSTQVFVMIIVFIINFLFENHKSPIIFFLQSFYSFNFIVLNLLFLLHYHYLPVPSLQNLLVDAEDTIIIAMISIICVKIIYQTLICGICPSLLSLCCEQDETDTGSNSSKRSSMLIITRDQATKQILKSKSPSGAQQQGAEKVEENILPTGFHRQLIEFFRRKTKKKQKENEKIAEKETTAKKQNAMMKERETKENNNSLKNKRKAENLSEHALKKANTATDFKVSKQEKDLHKSQKNMDVKQS